MVAAAEDEIFIDYDDCDVIQNGSENCLWSVHMPVFPLGTIGLNSSTADQTIARASVGAWGTQLNWRTLDSARQFAAAARIGYNGSETLTALISVRVQIIRHARTHSVGKYQSCMLSGPGTAR